MPPGKPIHITLIGAGTIGLSFAALHLRYTGASTGTPLRLTIHDSRPDIEEHVLNALPAYINGTFTKLWSALGSAGYGFRQEYQSPGDEVLPDREVIIRTDLESALSGADIVQEQGPENALFKTTLWTKVEQTCPPYALLWSSTSGIPASTQSTNMKDPSRLIVVHPFNPPHIMPLLELVPSPATNPEVITRTIDFWKAVGRTPIVLKKEITGFVANRLAFALLREAIYLVKEGVISVEDLDNLVTTSMGPRWAIAGPFKSYHAGGGQRGLEGFFKNIGGTVQECWDDAGTVDVGDGWEKDIFRQTREAYGLVDTEERDEKTKAVLEAARSKEKPSLQRQS
ncbi:hypothetical protein MMC28_001848 [Mycoblastus sanguinarius]|nr:hypothetical protein [Mycoblastus sanguinarius]